MSEGPERCEKGEDGSESSCVAPGEIVVVGVQEIVTAPAIYGEDLANVFIILLFLLLENFRADNLFPQSPFPFKYFYKV